MAVAKTREMNNRSFIGLVHMDSPPQNGAKLKRIRPVISAIQQREFLLNKT